MIRDHHPTLISGDLGVMVGYLDDTGGPTVIKSFGVYPILLFGTERLYGGIGLDYFHIRKVRGPSFDDEAIITTSYHTSPRVMTGITRGGKWRLNAELHLISLFMEPNPNEYGYQYGLMVSLGITRAFQQ